MPLTYIFLVLSTNLLNFDQFFRKQDSHAHDFHALVKFEIWGFHKVFFSERWRENICNTPVSVRFIALCLFAALSSVQIFEMYVN